MTQLTRNNHYVPQLYLKQWSSDGQKVCTYRILVSHDKVPEWNYQSISAVGNQRDLYTDFENGEEVDRFEKWMQSEFENPVQESIKNVQKERHLSAFDWDRLISFLAAQDVRTPHNYLESAEQWQTTLPGLIQRTLEESVRILENKEAQTANRIYSPETNKLLAGILDIKVVPSSESASGQGYIRAEVTVGRKLWLQSQELFLTRTINVLKKHKWCIARPARGYRWFTSDNPVTKLNFYGTDGYDLKGGWGRRGGNIFMPISPRHLLITQIGDELPDRLTLSTDQTKQFQKFIAEGAFRWIFAREPQALVRQLRPRHVDAQAFKNEAEQWKTWHEQQRDVEKPT
jgi:hypothetical protein